MTHVLFPCKKDLEDVVLKSLAKFLGGISFTIGQRAYCSSAQQYAYTTRFDDYSPVEGSQSYYALRRRER